MSPTAFLLYLGDGAVSAALELMRRICQPSSTSLPHITVRYSSRRVTDSALAHYQNALVEDLILSEVMTFDDDDFYAGELQTLVIGCESEDLEWLSYKPSFPNSVFHVTIYDGPKSEFAAAAFRVMKEFPWNLRMNVELEQLEELVAGHSKRANSDLGGVSLTPEAKSLLGMIAEKFGVPTSIGDLSFDDRIGLIRRLCEFVHNSPTVSHLPDRGPFAISRAFRPHAGQVAFWSESQVNVLSPHLDGSVARELKESATILTPPELAFDMIDAAVRLAGDIEKFRFGDPAIGPGIFYANFRNLVDEGRIESAEGVERNLGRARRAAQRWQRSGLRVIEGDFLEHSPPDQLWNFVVANPPYVRSQKLGPSFDRLREIVSKRVGIPVDGRADLYVYFLLAADSWIAPGGIAAWLIPSEFLVTTYGRAIRSYLTSNVTTLRIHTYDHDISMFDDSRVSSTVVIFRKERAKGQHLVQVSSGGTLRLPKQQLQMPMVTLAARERWNSQNLAVAARKSDVGVSIGEIFDVKRGIATGANALFVLSESQLASLDVHPEWVRPLLPKSRLLLSNVVASDASGLPQVSPRNWLIDTSVDLASIRRVSPAFGDYLDYVFDTVGQRNLVRQRHPFYRQEQRTPPLFAFVYMAKSGVGAERRFILNNSSAVILNNYLGLVPRPHLSDWLSQTPDGASKLHAKLLEVTVEEFALQGRSYISDLLKLEPSELRRVRIPGLELDDLAQIGLRAARSETVTIQE